MNLLNLERRLIRTVHRAGRLFRRPVTGVVEKDGAANLVTDTDLAVQRYLRAALARLIPHCGFLCEEEGVADTQKEYVWVIDPIDGTTNFARGIPECAISVGLLHRGEPVLGVVYAPRLRLTCSAHRGGGARCNGRPIAVSDKTFAQSLMCTALCLYQKELADACAAIMTEAHARCSDIRRTGSCALELCYLAMGRCDLYFEIRTYPWDYTAGYLILTEAGGILRGYGGQPLDCTSVSPLVGANNPENYALLEEIVSRHLPTLPTFTE